MLNWYGTIVPFVDWFRRVILIHGSQESTWADGNFYTIPADMTAKLRSSPKPVHIIDKIKAANHSQDINAYRLGVKGVETAAIGDLCPRFRTASRKRAKYVFRDSDSF